MLAGRLQPSPTQLCTPRCVIRCVASRKRNTASTTLRHLFAKWRAEGFARPPCVALYRAKQRDGRASEDQQNWEFLAAALSLRLLSPPEQPWTAQTGSHLTWRICWSRPESERRNVTDLRHFFNLLLSLKKKKRDCKTPNFYDELKTGHSRTNLECKKKTSSVVHCFVDRLFFQFVSTFCIRAVNFVASCSSWSLLLVSPVNVQYSFGDSKKKVVTQ